MNKKWPFIICWVAPAAWAAPTPPGLNPALAGQWLGGLVLVLILVFACLWLLQRLNRWNAPGGGQIRLLGGLSLGHRERMVVVELGETQLVLGVAPGRVQTLHVLEGDRRLSQVEVGGFGKHLRQALAQRGKGA
ncbi:MAG: flagellar biosynthetic protein FliO [Methylohalobius sp. ZOD2]|nr:flagellar biosynthetic protein FliO [Methylothermaceae bacterium]